MTSPIRKNIENERLDEGNDSSPQDKSTESPENKSQKT